MPDLIQTEHINSSGLACPKKNKNKKSTVNHINGKKKIFCLKNGKDPDDKWIKGQFLPKSWKSKHNKNPTKKCQPAAGDMPDLIQTEHVPSRGLACPQKKINRMKKK